MTTEEIKEIARQRGIKIGRMKKAEIVRAVQSREGNDECFATGRVAECGQANCLWLSACE